MNDFIVGEYQDKVFAVKVGKTEGHLVVVEFAEVRVQLHILQEIVHPAHVPLEGKAQSAFLRIVGDKRPCGGFLSNDHGTVTALHDNAV